MVNPLGSSLSTAKIAGPPAFVITATLFPFGIGKFSNPLAVLNKSFIVSTRIIPNCRRIASTTLSELLNAPV